MKRTDLLGAPELATATGLTYRQIDYFTNRGAIEATIAAGAHYRRRYHLNLVEPLRIVAALHRGAGASTGIPVELVAAIVDNYDDGYVDLADGLRLSWRADRPIEPRGLHHARQWRGPTYLTDAECDRLLEALEAEEL